MAYINNQGQLVYDQVDSYRVIQASYLADSQDEHWVDDLIAWWTGLFPCNKNTPAISHTEVGFKVDGAWWFFSSTSRPELGSSGRNGTRWIKESKLLRNPKRWLLQTGGQRCNTKTAFVSDDVKTEIDRANSLIGQPYDFIGVVFDFISPIDLIKRKRSIYCSKAVRYVLNGDFVRVSPRQQYKWFCDNFFVTCV